MDFYEAKEEIIKVGGQAYFDEVYDKCCRGSMFYFSFDDCFAILKPSVVNGCQCVHVEFAFSRRENGFMFGYRFVKERAKEIGAEFITFATKNNKLNRLAESLGWAKIDAGDYGDYWIIEL